VESIPEARPQAHRPLLGEALARRRDRPGTPPTPRASPQWQDAKLAIATASPALVAEIRARPPRSRASGREEGEAKGVDGAAVLKALRAEIASLQKKWRTCRASAARSCTPLGVVAAG